MCASIIHYFNVLQHQLQDANFAILQVVNVYNAEMILTEHI